MLNLKEIAERIAYPSQCQSLDTEDLKKLCETYPYSQVFPILYLKVLSKSNDVRFDGELQRYAYRISDRTMLYNLLNQTNFEAEENTIEVIHEPIVENRETIIQSKEEPEQEIVEEIKAETAFVQEIPGSVVGDSILNNKQDEIAEETEDTIEPLIIEKMEVIEPIEPIEAVETIESFAEKTIPKPEIEEPILEMEVEPVEIETIPPNELNRVKEKDIPEFKDEKIAEIHFELDLSNSSNEEIIDTPAAVSNPDDLAKIENEQLVVVGFESIPIDEVFQKLEEAQQVKDSQFKDDLTAHTIASAYSIEAEEKQLAKLKEVEEIKQAIITPIEKENKPPITTYLDEKRSFSNWLHSNDNYSESKEEKIDVDSLISKFIEDSPKISPANEKLFEGRTEKKEFYSPIKKAKESLDEQNLPVSETLAKVFAAQGNYPKAIYAYEQLMLIIPEKKISFAVQIKELQKKIK